MGMLPFVAIFKLLEVKIVAGRLPREGTRPLTWTHVI